LVPRLHEDAVRRPADRHLPCHLLARQGRIEFAQEEAFAPISLKAA